MKDLPSSTGALRRSVSDTVSLVVGARATVPLWILATVAFIFFAQDAKPFLAPVVTSAVVSIILNPIARFFQRRTFLGRGPSAIVSLIIAGLVVGGALWLLIPATENWQGRLLTLVTKAEAKLFPISSTLDDVQSATKKVEDAANLSGETRGQVAGAAPRAPSYYSQILGSAPFAIIQVLSTIIISFYFLSERRWLWRCVLGLFTTYHDRYRAGRVGRKVRRNVGIYFLTACATSAGVGLLTGLSFLAIGMPAPATWGGAMAVANFVPFIGPFLVSVSALFVGLATFDTLSMCLLPAAVIVIINLIEENFVSPLISGRQFYTSPVLIILAVLFGGWLWGIIGAVLAVPVAITVLSALRQWRGTAIP